MSERQPTIYIAGPMRGYDDGCQSPDDVSKAFGVGADFVMLVNTIFGNDS